MQEKTTKILSALFTGWAGRAPESIAAVPAAGSNRYYFRLTGGGKTAVGAYGSDLAENRAFFAIDRQLRKKGVRVPELYAIDDSEYYYLLEDLGNVALFDLLQKQTEAENFPLLQAVVEQLAFLQIGGAQGFDFSTCYPVDSFDRQSIFWDLNYFKYCFLKPKDIAIDEVRLERDFERLADYLLAADSNYFMYRDFQSRNIMVHDGQLGFIDFQGGRRGPLQYDLASFLFQAKAQFSDGLREALLQHYLETAAKYTVIDNEEFRTYYYPFVLFRTLQVLGSYGFRGLVERKSHFMESIPFALLNAQWLLGSGKLEALNVPYLLNVLQGLVLHNQQATTGKRQPDFPLTVEVKSFSYRNGYPVDTTGNGGGYIFDCRGLNNPGRLPELLDFTGKDKCIIDFLEQQSNVGNFLQHAFSLVSLSVDNYLERGFTDLFVAFGCTGGKHRSVYCAERMAVYLKEKYPETQVVVTHREFPAI